MAITLCNQQLLQNDFLTIHFKKLPITSLNYKFVIITTRAVSTKYVQVYCSNPVTRFLVKMRNISHYNSVVTAAMYYLHYSDCIDFEVLIKTVNRQIFFFNNLCRQIDRTLDEHASKQFYSPFSPLFLSSLCSFMTPLHVAAERAHNDIMEVLQKHGAKVGRISSFSSSASNLFMYLFTSKRNPS